MIDVIFFPSHHLPSVLLFYVFQNEPRETYVHGPEGSHQLTNAANDIYKS
jgi:hypothetical protein